MKNINIRKIAVCAVILFAISILPMLILGIYDHPSADDFSYSVATRQVWIQSHSVLQVLGTALATAADRFLTWQGTYTSIIFMSLQPAIWGDSFYILTPIIMLFSVIFSVFFLCRVLVIRWLDGTKSESTVLSVLILSSMLQCMPDGTDGLYWFNGSVHYIVPTTAAFVLFGLVLSMLKQPEVHTGRRLTGSFFCALLVGGGNYVTGLAALVCAACIVLSLIFTKKLKEHYIACLPLLSCLIFFLINAAAPGNAVRSAAIGGIQMGPVKAILVSFRYALYYAVEEWLDWTILILLLLAVPFLWKIVKNSSFTFPLPIPVAALSYCLFASAFTPGLFAAGNINAPRIQNAIFLLFVLLLYFNAGYLLGWICRRMEPEKEGRKERELLSHNQLLCAAAAFIMLFFGAGVTVIPNPDYYTATAACTELVSGEAKAYDQEIKARNEQLKGPEKNVVLLPLTHQPDLLFFSDILTDKDDWANRAMSRYYSLESVVLSTEK